MTLSQDERAPLLSVKGIGPTIVQRLEQLGFSSLAELAVADVGKIVSSAAALVGSSGWKNSPQARASIQSVVAMAKLRQ